MHTCTSMHSQLHGAVQWVGTDTAQWLTTYSAHLRAIAAQSSNRGAPCASSRPKRLDRNREDPVYDGVLTVEVAQVVEVVGVPYRVVPPNYIAFRCGEGKVLAFCPPRAGEDMLGVVTDVMADFKCRFVSLCTAVFRIHAAHISIQQRRAPLLRECRMWRSCPRSCALIVCERGE
jgi:hypothetical protein